MRKGKGKRKLPKVFMPIPPDDAKKACKVLSGPELRTYFAICAQSQHWNNGTAMLCRPVMHEWNLGSHTTVTAAKNKLLAHGLIVQTRKSAQQRAAMYGVTYLALNDEAMAKAGASATTAVSLNGHSAKQTGVAQQPYNSDSAAATAAVAQNPSDGASATKDVACDEKKCPPALQLLLPSKNLPCGKGNQSATEAPKS
jgi:hypothetical protein